MLFNSYAFIFLFLPLTLSVYFYLNSKRLLRGGLVFLVFASLFFYSWWNIIYLPLILSSIVYNFMIGSCLSKTLQDQRKKICLTLGISANLALLGYFKYTDFFFENINYALSWHIPLPHFILPLGISFFTFTQIAYLVDCYKHKVKEYDFLRYTLFVTFFPHLLAGPILHHSEMMPQFSSLRHKKLNYKNISIGLVLFSIGLFKKTVIADTFAVWANAGFDTLSILTLFEAWATSLSYTFQLYFDFSGYTDMAIGVSLFFNIKLPINFNSPYKALNIQDFWRRWHITLSRFLKDYIYIPLGGNRHSTTTTYMNLFITFLLGGIWHGAGWTFVFWGILHGLALMLHRLWQSFHCELNRYLAWFITFNFINFSWIFFRAKQWDDAIKVIQGMLGFNGILIDKGLENFFLKLALFPFHAGRMFDNIPQGNGSLKWILAALCISVFFKNSNELALMFKPRKLTAFLVSLLFVYGLFNTTKISQFLYFNF